MLIICNLYGYGALTVGEWAGTLMFASTSETLNPFTIRATDIPNEYEISNLFAGWFTEGTTSENLAQIKDIIAEYDEELGQLSIAPGQNLFDYDNGGSLLHVSLISASITDEGTFKLHPDAPILLSIENGMLKLDGQSAFYLGQMVENEDYAMGFGYAWKVSLSPINGSMTYQSYDSTGWCNHECSALLSLNGDDSLSIDNICGLGFGRSINFDVSGNEIVADNVVYGTLVSGTQQITVYPCSCDKYGDPVLEDGKFVFRGTIQNVDTNKYSVDFGLWGIFDSNKKPYYHFRNTKGEFTTVQSGVIETIVSSSDDSEHWYSIQGIPVNPINANHGIYIVKTKNKTYKILK